MKNTRLKGQSFFEGGNMGESNSRDLKDAIILESIKLFLAKGFRGTSVKEITEAAGVSRGAVYWYFKSKDEILESIFRKFDAEYLEGAIKAVADCDGNFVAKYRAFHKFATEFARENKDLSLVFNTLLNEIVGTNMEAERVVKTIYEKYRRFIAGMLEDGKRDGSVKKELDSALYAHVIIASHSGMLVEWFVNGASLDVRAFVKTFRDILLKGATEQ
jgi:AcrR family transcriptional regulator